MESTIRDRANSQTLNLTKLDDKIQLVFDYEMNYTKIKDILKESKLFYYDENNDLTQINYDLFFDKLKPLPKIIPNKDPNKAKYNSSIYDEDFEELEDEKEEDFKKANIFKRLVSKQKRRFHDSDFDLDMSYITEKVIAMGFPSTGMQALYRNSLTDIIKFFKTKHNDIVKVYNLCIEKDRIYNKDIFPNSKVGLFPATDHNPSPIKLILEFCIDICLYLIKNPKGVAAVHCKAGKGRTGVMICSYLVFSGLCKNCEQAFRYYGRMRTKNNTGVTIASQRRYIRYFETFLKANFYPPYYKLIPKIIKSQFSFLMDEKNNIKITNILQSFQTEESYFISANKFKLKGIKLGPLPRGKDLKIKVCNFVDSKFKLKNKKLTEVFHTDKNNAYYEQNFMPELVVHSDIKITIKNDFNFYVWVNFWHSTLEMIRIFNEEYGVRKKAEINSVQDIKFSDLVSTKKGKKKKVKITNIDSENNDNNEKNPLYDKIQSLVHNSDLNELLELIESNSDVEFDKDNMSIKVNSTEFDKFQEKKEYTKSFEMIIFYSLSNK